MTVPFKFLPHEILNKPKPVPAIHIYPQAPHEFLAPSQQRSQWLLPSQWPPSVPASNHKTHNPQTTQKKEKIKSNPRKTHQPPTTGTLKSTLTSTRPSHQNPLSTYRCWDWQATIAVEIDEPLPLPRSKTSSHLPLSAPPSRYHQASVPYTSRRLSSQRFYLFIYFFSSESIACFFSFYSPFSVCSFF